jgi:hypothetical protein
MNSNTIMTSLGLYTDVIGMVNDYCNGDRDYWKSKYDQVLFRLKCLLSKHFETIVLRPQDDPFMANIRKALYDYQRKVIRRKISSVIHCAQSQGDGNKTRSIADILHQYNVVGIYRVAFDIAVRRISQTMGLTQWGEYMYKININNPMLLEISRQLFRHLQDYNYTEYMSIFRCRWKLWAIKMDWGTRDIQTIKQAINKEIKQEGINRKRKRDMIEQETDNSFAVGYRLGSKFIIRSINQKSITVYVAGMIVNKKVNTEKKTGRIYICNPVLKRTRLYADEKKYISK